MNLSGTSGVLNLSEDKKLHLFLSKILGFFTTKSTCYLGGAIWPFAILGEVERFSKDKSWGTIVSFCTFEEDVKTLLGARFNYLVLANIKRLENTSKILGLERALPIVYLAEFPFYGETYIVRVFRGNFGSNICL